jgi:hypothetical protein
MSKGGGGGGKAMAEVVGSDAGGGGGKGRTAGGADAAGVGRPAKNALTALAAGANFLTTTAALMGTPFASNCGFTYGTSTFVVFGAFGSTAQSGSLSLEESVGGSGFICARLASMAVLKVTPDILFFSLF